MKRTYVRVTLTMQSGWRVGAWESQAADVVATLTDSDGHPIVPGSGIAGALRQAAGDKREELFGKDPGSADLVASPWWVLGTVVGGSTTQDPSTSASGGATGSEGQPRSAGSSAPRRSILAMPRALAR